MTDDFHDNAYDGLLDHHTVMDDSQWAFGTDFEDPLAGVDTTIPDGVDARRARGVLPDARRRRPRLLPPALASGAAARPTSRRTSRWPTSRSTCSARPGCCSPGPRPPHRRASRCCPRTRRCRPRTRWPSSATDAEFRNVRLVEPDNGDFAVTIVRLLLFSTWRLALLERLVSSRDHVLVRDRGEGRQGGDLPPRLRRSVVPHPRPGHRRVALAAAGRAAAGVAFHDELFTDHPVETAVAAAGVGVAPSSVAAEVGVILEQVFSVSARRAAPACRRSDRSPVAWAAHGRHTEALSHLLAEMQSVARAHPRGLW